jgi:hypothetical protein
MAQWVGEETWDPTAFDTIAANTRLAGIKL